MTCRFQVVLVINTSQSCDYLVYNLRMGGRKHKKSKKLTQEGKRGVQSDLKVSPKFQEGHETLQKIGRKTQKPKIDKDLPSGVASSIIEESVPMARV